MNNLISHWIQLEIMGPQRMSSTDIFDLFIRLLGLRNKNERMNLNIKHRNCCWWMMTDFITEYVIFGGFWLEHDILKHMFFARFENDCLILPIFESHFCWIEHRNMSSFQMAEKQLWTKQHEYHALMFCGNETNIVYYSNIIEIERYDHPMNPLT